MRGWWRTVSKKVCYIFAFMDICRMVIDQWSLIIISEKFVEVNREK